MFLIRSLSIVSVILMANLSHANDFYILANPESTLAAPDVDATDNKIDYDQYWIYRNDYTVAIGANDNKVKGFGFDNRGGNSTVVQPELVPGQGPMRSYTFGFKDRARQDIHLWVSDVADSVVSNFLESAFYFFPRHVLPAIDVDSTNSNRLVVTLPTRETFVVDRDTKVVLSGVLKEDSPLDMNPNPSKRKYAAISYSGKGLYLRANYRANSPQLAKSVSVYLNGKTCSVPGSEVFNQDYYGAMTFKFATDASFDSYLWSKCKFRIPNL